MAVSARATIDGCVIVQLLLHVCRGIGENHRPHHCLWLGEERQFELRVQHNLVVAVVHPLGRLAVQLKRVHLIAIAGHGRRLTLPIQTIGALLRREPLGPRVDPQAVGERPHVGHRLLPRVHVVRP